MALWVRKIVFQEALPLALEKRAGSGQDARAPRSRRAPSPQVWRSPSSPVPTSQPENTSLHGAGKMPALPGRGGRRHRECGDLPQLQVTPPSQRTRHCEKWCATEIALRCASSTARSILAQGRSSPNDAAIYEIRACRNSPRRRRVRAASHLSVPPAPAGRCPLAIRHSLFAIRRTT